MKDTSPNWVKYKHKRGVVLYSINQEYLYEKKECPTCKGTGKMMNMDKEEFMCPLCDGTGGRDMFKGLRWKVFKGVVKGVRITIDTKDTNIYYDMIKDRKANISDLWSEINVYDNLEVATKECEESNKITDKYNEERFQIPKSKY